MNAYYLDFFQEKHPSVEVDDFIILKDKQSLLGGLFIPSEQLILFLSENELIGYSKISHAGQISSPILSSDIHATDISSRRFLRVIIEGKPKEYEIIRGYKDKDKMTIKRKLLKGGNK